MELCTIIETGHLISTAKIQVIVHGKHITRGFKHMIRFNFGTKQLEQQITQANEWLPATFSQVNWTTHRLAHNKHSSTKFNKKLYHRLLPAVQIKHQQKASNLATCQSCSYAIETNEHIFLYPILKQTEWQTQFLIKLRKYSEKIGTNYTLLAVLFKGLTFYFKQLRFDPTWYTEKYSALIHQQNQIGWFNLLRSPYSTRWTNIQSKITSNTNTTLTATK